MATLTIRNVDEKTHRALRLRAAEHGQSVEEEVRRILAERADTIPAHGNPRSPEEIAAAANSLQSLFAPLRAHYSVDQFVAEKRREAARERVEETGK